MIRVTLAFLAVVGCHRESNAPVGGGDDSAAVDDTGTSSASDADADGWSEKAGDCDDANAAVHPGAYDRPNDGVDEDCVGGDRTCDCLVLDAGTTLATTYDDFDTTASRTLDLAYVLETGMSATSTIHAASDSFYEVVSALGSDFSDMTFGVGTYDDYAYNSYGSAANGNKPFELRQQQTNDSDLVHDVLDGIPQHDGDDSPESTMEGLYQALTGAGYDQDCDESYDSSTDVKPFIAGATDPFGGTGGQFLDVTDESTGRMRGMGFHRETALRVIVYTADSWLRDPDNGYGTPGGCALDAGFHDVVKAAEDADVWLVGIGTSDVPIPQMEDLAEGTGSLADLDIDGSDEVVVYELEPTTDTFRDAILEALDAIRIESGLFDVYASVTLEVREDSLGIVSGITPASYADVAWGDADSLAFDVDYDTSAYGTEPDAGFVEFELVGDGFDLATVHLDIEIAPP